MNLTAKAFWVTAPGCGDIREEKIAAESVENEVLVRTLYSGISRGTESLVFHGQIPESEFQRMRCPFQQGEFPAPVKYGYASVGVVEQGPDDLLGRQVFCLYPHQDRYRVPATAVHVLPDGVPPQRAILAANMETALNGIWDSRVGAGDRVGIIGAGVVGAMCAWLAGQFPATDTTLIDIDPSRGSLAGSLGVSFALPDDAPGELDVLIHASGSQAGLARALQLAGDEAVVVELSWYGSRQPRLALGESFHSRRLTLRSSQVGQLPLERRARWDHRRRLGKALELLTDPVMEELISGESALSDLPAIMPELTESSGRVLCHRVVYE
jgi:NADPH:quinone reductase-like Zn-dependent oxidoreductase